MNLLARAQEEWRRLAPFDEPFAREFLDRHGIRPEDVEACTWRWKDDGTVDIDMRLKCRLDKVDMTLRVEV